jgi:cytoskeletal protein CcmA (bactofilin family)
MLESFRKKDTPKSATAASPYSRMQEALSPARPAEGIKTAEPAANEAPRTEITKIEPEIVQQPAIAAPAASPTNDPVSRLIVGADIKLKGVEITDCDTLVVEGRVEASMDSRVIQIAEHGVFIGKVGIDIAEIRGHFEGELDARKQLVIHSTGRVSGKIRYGKITIEEGGELSGDVAALGTAKTAGSKSDASFNSNVKAVGSR